MNQTSFNLRLRVEEVRRLTNHRVKVHVRGAVGEGISFGFTMETSETDTPKVNDYILVTITTPAPSDGGPRMPKYRITTTVDTEWDVIVEAEDEQDARNRAIIDFDNSRDLLEPRIELYPVADETELGDVG